MADLVITATGVLPGDNAVMEQMIALEPLVAGKVVYRDPVTMRAGLADNNAVQAERRVVRGIALNGAAIGQPVTVLREGLLTMGATMATGVTYYLSDTPGGVCPVADLTTGEFSVILGMAISATVMRVKVQASGVAI